jgi:hypothetical protein
LILVKSAGISRDRETGVTGYSRRERKAVTAMNQT